MAEKKIAILGTTPSRMEGPINDPTWEIWTIGPGGKDAHRWDRLFEVHGTWPEDFKGYLNDLSNVKSPQQVVTMASMKEKILGWAEDHNKSPEVLKQEITGDWSSNVVYPKDKILRKYGREMWFSSSISWLIPLAIEEGATDIGLWGIDLEAGEEYISQFVGCAHFLDMARLLGINVHLPHGSGMLRDFRCYPDRYETHFALNLEKKRKWLEHNHAQAESDLEGTKMMVHRLEGRLIALREMGKDVTEVEQELMKFNTQLHHQAMGFAHLRGEKSATDYYYRMYVIGLNEPEHI